MTSGNVFPAMLLVLFLATGTDFVDVLSFGQSTPRADLRIVLVTLSDPSDSMGHLSDAFESSLHLRAFAEDARSSLLRLADRAQVAIESIRVTIDFVADRTSRQDACGPSTDRMPALPASALHDE